MKLTSPLMIVVFLCSPLALAGPNPADYPLKVRILRQGWVSRNTYRGVYSASGLGNVTDGDSTHGFDFRYECSIGLRRTPRNQSYPARWKKPQLRLDVLAAQIGKDNEYRECRLDTSVREGVYVIGPGGISELSQADFKNREARDKTAPGGQSGPAPADVAPVARVSIRSNAADAEIEVDGEFVGNTPSVLNLGTGDRTIVVRKTGYARWEKKLRLVPGEVTLTAELQPETPSP
jgi:hypothetical protein